MSQGALAKSLLVGGYRLLTVTEECRLQETDGG